MGLYEGIKDVANILRKADDVELYRQLIDLSSQALDLQQEVVRLTQENTELRKTKDIESQIERHEELFLTCQNDSGRIKYCTHCWDYESKLIQVHCNTGGEFHCIHCDNSGILDHVKYANEPSQIYAVPRFNKNRY